MEDSLEQALEQAKNISKTLRRAYSEHDHNEYPAMGMYLASLVTASDGLIEQILSAIMFKNNQPIQGE